METKQPSTTVIREHQDKEQLGLTRRTVLKYAAFGLLGLLASSMLTAKAKAGYGECSQCSCPGFIGSGYACVRGGCGHHYDEHW